ncbi:MAG TPA: molybdopterin-dependent oxidoreductase [Acidimicrobiales bacterium]|nr:molybdopterin-dependent oxidoreductase [Acidimicrobiales bacterium]
MTETHFRTCPLCEATCGLEITVRDGAVVRIRGDRDDVFSRGFICPKGSALKHLHEDPNRLRVPHRRTPEGHVPITWDEAWAEIEDRLGAIRTEHGPDAVGVYLGNPNVHSLVAPLFLPHLIRALGTRNLFSASTVDQVPRNVSTGLMYGDPYGVLLPDIDRTSYLLMLGANPFESNGSLASAPDWPGRLGALRARGGRLVVVDPRRTKTAAAADEHLAIRPGTDSLFLCALANVIATDGLVDLGDAAPHVNGIEEALAAVTPWTPERVAGPTGIDAATTRRLAHELAAADRAVVYGRIGVHTVRGGTVASWATDLLTTITGNLDRPGGGMFGLGAHSAPRSPEGGGRGFKIARWTSRVSGRPEAASELPVAVLAEEIETPGPGQIRALLTIAGNPVLSTPHSERLDAALATLDFMVSVDLYLNETTRHADIVLPVPSQLEKSHYDIVFTNQTLRQVANWSEAIFPTEQPSEREVLTTLTTIAGGGPPPFGGATEEEILDGMLRKGPWGLTLDDLRAHPHGIDLGPLEPRLPSNLRTPSAKVELAPPEIIEPLPELLASIEADASAVDGELLLVGRRHVRSNNSWMHHIDMLVRGKDRTALHLHPRDAAAHCLVSGDTVTICSRVGELDVVVEVTEEVMPGVVSLPHGWARVNSNVLTDGEAFDPISGNATLNGIPVRLRPGGARSETPSSA